MVVAVVAAAAAHGFAVLPLGTRGPFKRETGSAWAPYFLFVEFVSGESKREEQSGAA